jgi:hypothetical protein
VKENDVSNRASKQRSILFERIYFYVNWKDLELEFIYILSVSYFWAKG